MRPEQRRAEILTLVNEKRKVTVDFLSENFSASRETIRRDLTDLAINGQLRKFHGGATVLDNFHEGKFSTRLSEQSHEKKAISQLAATLFQTGDSLFIDTGTTTLAFARELAVSAKELTIFTNSVSITQILASSGGNHRVFLIGGQYRDDAAENIGPIAVAQIKQFQAAHVVMTIGALDTNGVMDYDLEETEIAKAMISMAKKVTVLADNSKLGRSALFSVCSLNQVDRLITDAVPDDDLLAALKEAGVEVLTTNAINGKS
ncbi:DeoR/GlpR family DNA-binding transcription regulator [Buttiauxella sp. WJP83]|uniref:DeoR/GlpR family DNA-binding transcription regulator n=1 Tax=Buttiauxella sp. WJP83 TaxID=2986951 RepID=UPI0022DD740A|nr:DeoR/GlpR family DNA-binding transcription regulator [Buttiauxella sp. WJP83]WBM69335.1 DeoR/GlpR family DNA-binding transcription regulator [Buttiauxella sp. WJP83]